ncbi:Sporulation related domain protein [Enhygromyxa salina]|uniref:Sporulation related domain protein n=1 Tax=Enhygromyxa salina TaxID=215803 RepID=A0A2S9XXE2_9BACT|nr:SPOR domain-containing protein [Enhygromyxa salina]PRP97539.1 Sporulation related domain protein [Enhygromyxa salina]
MNYPGDMLSQISLVMLTLLSHFNPGAVDLIELAERVGITRAVEHEALDLVATVQLDLLPDREGAEALAATIEQRVGGEFEVFVETIATEAELPPSYRVGVGPFTTFEDAERARTKLDGLGVDGFVRELDDILGC